ncbi:excisionase family DNA-binding protein [Algoriphagus sp. D3-2-R+10]|uniref:excisionase family DNA-binding protein n=1 Tax=Algoriphagus aurantiacus TaxID=3103948 RepID=UPI002B3C5B29|nr:excisionase family DNA-binding protein [Algoriphagus sp. D3-2-R+10]MEB2776785.1 excisionase family DNA-binding protein [Algoriphagus sp. D3-2-R+10]
MVSFLLIGWLQLFVSMTGYTLRFIYIKFEINERSFEYFVYLKTTTIIDMNTSDDIERPSKEEQKAAMESYDALAAALDQIHSDYPEIEIEETSERIKIPMKALQLLAKILKETSQGKPVSIVPIATEITTQAAAELIGCSRPHLVKLLENGEISYTKIGKHRRIKYQDIIDYKRKMKADQRKLLIEIMKADEETELYDS